MPPDAVKVDRSTRWGNGYRIGSRKHIGAFEEGEFLDAICATVEDCVASYRAHLLQFMEWDPPGAARFLGPLRGKNLACWCALGAPCHADVLLALANGGAK